MAEKTFKTGAFWISPRREVFEPRGSHIADVIAHPEKFGTTRARVEAAYKKYHEPLGLEGAAREEIIIELVKNGWVRLRNYRQHWSATVPGLSPDIEATLQKWAIAVINGVNGRREPDILTEVRILEVAKEKTQVRTLSALASFQPGSDTTYPDLTWLAAAEDLPDPEN